MLVGFNLIAPALALEGFVPVYWITGKINGAPERTIVYFYKELAGVTGGDNTKYTTGVTDKAGNFTINAYSATASFMVVGENHFVATGKDAEGKGAGPKEFKVSGRGVDVIPDMDYVVDNLAGGLAGVIGGVDAGAGAGAGAGARAETKLQVTITDSKSGAAVNDASVQVASYPVLKTDAAGLAALAVAAGTYSVSASKDTYIPGVTNVTIANGETKAVALAIEPSTPPAISGVKFGNRLYQPALVAKGDIFVVTANPAISANITNVPASGVKTSSVALTIDGGMPAAKKYQAADLTPQVLKAQSVSGVDRVSEMSIKFDIPETAKLEEGKHVIEFTASNDYGVSAVYTASVEVLGGPLRIIGTPITYPSPFSSIRQKTCYIQYTLSKNANIEIYIADVTGQRVKRYVINSGEEGGSAGVNKISWDGTTDQGVQAGNAIYVGVIVARDENKLLEKFKLTIVN